MRLPGILPFFDPVVLLPAWVTALVNDGDMVPLRLDRQLEALGPSRRDVEAQEGPRREPFTQDERGNRRRRGGGRPEVVRSVGPRQRHGDARHAQERPFQRARHRPRVRHVVAEIVSLVDAGHDEVGQRAKQLRDPDVHAVGRRAVDFVHAIAQPLHPQRTAKRKRVTDGAGLDMRRDDGDIPKGSKRGSQGMDAVGVDAIVIGNQYAFHQEVSNSTGERALIIAGAPKGIPEVPGSAAKVYRKAQSDRPRSG